MTNKIHSDCDDIRRTFLEKSHVHRDFLEPDHRRHAGVRPEVAARHVHQAEDVGATEDATWGVTTGPGDRRGRVAIHLARQGRGVAEVGRHVRRLGHELRPVWNNEQECVIWRRISSKRPLHIKVEIR